jgi:hypothetical protein
MMIKADFDTWVLRYGRISYICKTWEHLNRNKHGPLPRPHDSTQVGQLTTLKDEAAGSIRLLHEIVQRWRNGAKRNATNHYVHSWK